MGSFWKVKRFLGLKFDLLDAYSYVLDDHPSSLEPIEVLPAAKSEIKKAIFEEAILSSAMGRAEYVKSLLVCFLSLANFQKGLQGKSLNLTEGFQKASRLNGNELVDAVLDLGPAIGASGFMSEFVEIERKQLADEWQNEIERFAKSYEAHLIRTGGLHAPR